MTVRDLAQTLLPTVRAEIQQLQQLEASLLRVLGEASPEPAAQADADDAHESAVPDAAGRPLETRSAEARRAAVLGTLKARGPLRVAVLAAQLDLAQSHVQTDLTQLLHKGLVARVAPGTYASVEVVWSGRSPLINPETPALAQRLA